MITLMQKLPKNLTPGKVLYRFYYAPLDAAQKLAREGLVNSLLTRRGRLRMEEATDHLEPLVMGATQNARDIHFLTGRTLWYQTCFCAYSMNLQSDFYLRPVIHDDGTLGVKYADKIKRIFPNAKIITAEESEERLNQSLPMKKFPCLRGRRTSLIIMRKLTDIHAGTSGWKLFLDSDMLFFRKPVMLLDWLKSPRQPCHMLDVASAYGYTEGLMSSLAGAPVPPRVNSGICGLRSDAIDWERVERWCNALIEKEDTHYFQEQALTAMLLATQPRDAAPAEHYIVKPVREDVIARRGVMHHYVAESKAWYFRYGWKLALERQDAASGKAS